MSRLHPRRKPAKYGTKKRVVHEGKAVITLLANGEHRLMSQREAVSQIGRSKGGRTAQQRGTAHRFTREEASKAAKKLWATRYRMNQRIGTRLGRPAKLKPMVRRQPIRDQRTWSAAWAQQFPILVGEGQVLFDADLRQWFQWDQHLVRHYIGERTALRKLGYLPYPRKGTVPLRIVQQAPNILCLGRKRAVPNPGSWSVTLLPGVKS